MIRLLVLIWFCVIKKGMPTYSPNSILEPNSPFGEPQSCCLECGAYAVLQKCKAHCNLDICDDCKQKHWQFEVDDLLKMKTHLEDNIIELKNYLCKFSRIQFSFSFNKTIFQLMSGVKSVDQLIDQSNSPFHVFKNSANFLYRYVCIRKYTAKKAENFFF